MNYPLKRGGNDYLKILDDAIATKNSNLKILDDAITSIVQEISHSNRMLLMNVTNRSWFRCL